MGHAQHEPCGWLFLSPSAALLAWNALHFDTGVYKSNYRRNAIVRFSHLCWRANQMTCGGRKDNGASHDAIGIYMPSHNQTKPW